VELIIRPGFNLDFKLLKDHSSFFSLTESDFKEFKKIVEEVHHTGTIRKMVISNKKDSILYYEIQFIPEFDTKGQVSNVIVHTI
jgi:hypothetical protein